MLKGKNFSNLIYNGVVKVMLCRLISLLVISVIGICVDIFATPSVQDVGANSTGTVVAVNVSTVPALLLTKQDYLNTAGFTMSSGTYLANRIQMEIYNDSSIDIYVGYNANVSSITGRPYYGRRIPSGSAWSHNCSIEQHWAISGSSTGFNVIVTQER